MTQKVRGHPWRPASFAQCSSNCALKTEAKRLHSGQKSECTNPVNGQSYSVMEVVKGDRRVTGLPIEVKIEAARADDISRLIANSEKAVAVLNWKTEYRDPETIICSAWEWYLQPH